jgi:TetR/AcrR family transcriptional regulator, transcriptional repressor for nem operon
MRRSKQEAAGTRQRIVKAAAAEFRQNGIGGTGLSDLMASAGLTHGGFYRHFDSKDQIVAEACATAAESAIATFFSNKSPQSGLKTLIAKYLSTAHRDDRSAGCPLVALGSEIVRGDEKTRAAATQAFLQLVDIIAAESSKTRPDVTKRRALVTASTMIGALMMSRIVTDSELSTAILRQSEKHLVSCLSEHAV